MCRKGGAMKVYWAHSKKIYNTPEEAEILAVLEKVFDKVVCPNRDIGEKGDIQPYLDAIDDCDAVIVSEYQDHIGKGVYDEVLHTIDNTDLEAYVLRNWELVAIIHPAIVDPNDWAVNYGRLVTNILECLPKEA